MLFLLIETKLDAYFVPVRSGRLYPLERKNNSILKHSMGTCAAQLACLRNVCGHVTVSDHRLSKPEGFNVSFYFYMW